MTGSQVRILRNSKGLNQLDFAKLLGYERAASISDIENDKTQLSHAAMLVIATVFPYTQLQVNLDETL